MGNIGLEGAKDYIRKDMQETLDNMLSRNVGIEKYWEYLGRLNLARQLLSRMNCKIRINVFVEDEGM